MNSAQDIGEQRGRLTEGIEALRAPGLRCGSIGEQRRRLTGGIAMLATDPLPQLYSYEGCRGLRNSLDECPVALWLSRWVGDASVVVSTSFAYLMGDSSHVYVLPDSLSQLIYEIDSGSHPNLLSPNPT